MTPARPTCGDFVRAASTDLAAAAAQPPSVTPGRDASEQAAGLARLSRVLTRYTSDLTRMINELPDEHLSGLGPWDRAALRTHDALTSACRALAQDERAARAIGPVSCPAARSLHAAARSLAAGRDLLQGHFTIEPSGARLYRSGWSPAITSPGVCRALLTEVAALAQQAAAAGNELASKPPGDLRADSTRSRLSIACYWLNQPATFTSAAERAEPGGGNAREVLHAVPENVMPVRPSPQSARSVHELCAAVITTAERARAAAWHAASAEPTSTAICSISWYRIAAASTVSSHHCHLLYSALAERAAAEQVGELSAILTRAASQADQAREYWLDSAREFRDIATDVQNYISPAAAEATDLALWTGKLAYADTDWTLSIGPGQPVRAAAGLAPKIADVPGVVAAVHEASDALGTLATANLEQAGQAVRGRRLLVATRSLPEKYDIPLRYSEPPEPYAASLVACCHDTAQKAGQVAETGSEIAARVGAPSRTLVALRAAAREQPERRPAADPGRGARTAEEVSGIGPVESRLRGLGIEDVRHLWRATAIDRAAEQVVREATADHESRAPANSPRVSSDRQAALASATVAAREARPPLPDLEAEP
jgi:hypothetical protein